MSDELKKQLKKGADKIASIFIGVIVTVIGFLTMQILFFGVFKANRVEASHLIFKDKVIDLMSSYKDFTINNMNLLREMVNKNKFYIENLDVYIKDQKQKALEQDNKMDRIIQDLRDVNKTVLVTMTKLEMQSSQTITIEEAPRRGK